MNKVKLTINGKLTRTALLLVGKDEAEHLLLPADLKIRWLLKDHQSNDREDINQSKFLFNQLNPPLTQSLSSDAIKCHQLTCCSSSFATLPGKGIAG